ncbi:potassium/proton antiporter [uncultured Sneathiella sp.]|jgi:cell volume regulation protein A|uniref:potassium/proton antiporter n=1 Tax=uncultured Sneathiella sp. TaxID=879315 RepID=UPI0030DA6034|tara:strand:- start:23453 stop:24688 length:1236 start_codon:yes stop_codon:yes gene_type:complete
MESLEILLIFVSFLFLIGCLLTPIAERLGAPFLLLFLFVGMFMGENGIGGVSFNDFNLAYEVGSIALALVLFSGGLDTTRDTFRKAAAPAIVLAIFGVLATAGIVGGLIFLIFDLPLQICLLLGAVVGSTDAAATFLLLRQRNIQLKDGLGETLMVEAGINDPMAIFLTITMVAIVDNELPLDIATFISFLPELGRQLGYGLVAGIIGGVLIAFFINRVRMPVSLFAPFAMASALLLFNLTALLGGSGFLAVFIAGALLRDRMTHQTERVRQFHDGISWISQIVLFLILGLLVTPKELIAQIPLGLGIAAVLIFIARPIATSLSLTPFRIGWRQQAFIGWVGLRGAVPIFLAIIPVISPGPLSSGFFDVVFVVVIVSLILQGWTISLAARWLGLIAEPEGEAELPLEKPKD